MCFAESDIVSLQTAIKKEKYIEYRNPRHKKKHPNSGCKTS
jgi:hypothetical protein